MSRGTHITPSRPTAARGLTCPPLASSDTLLNRNAKGVVDGGGKACPASELTPIGRTDTKPSVYLRSKGGTGFQKAHVDAQGPPLVKDTVYRPRRNIVKTEFPTRSASPHSRLQPFRFGATLRLIILVTGLMGWWGCDPVRTIQHSVTMDVTDNHGAPVPDMKVSMKESWESWQTRGGGTANAERSYFYQRWKNEIPWLRGVTDTQGQAVIEIRTAALDWTKGNDPPTTRDWVSGREHVIRLEGPKGQEDIRLVLTPGAVGTGQQYTVTIQDIEKPRYVPEPTDSAL